ncbi:MAG: hypothetical protein EOM62_08830 [Bacteroidia bacterium]|nr:hypothetical protein [Bacteroidia bacterium]
MKGTLADYVQFRGDRLFDGAVDVSWLINHKEKAECAAAAYIFHGPEYHGVSQEDVGSSHGHRLIDTASFTQQIIQRCNAIEDKPFTLAIAGYGTGKSHLATTLATLLSNPNSTTSSEILRQLERADSRIYESVRAQLSLMAAPALVVTLNGMGNFDLATEFTRQILFHLQTANINTQALDALRPRFKTAENLIARLTSDERKIILEECGISEPEEIIKRLHTYDESIYTIVQANLAKLGFTIKAIGDETVTDVIETVCREYVGEGRRYSKLVIVFDEFGRYAEFATVRSQIAGNGVLQQLYEGVQSNSNKAIFIGFIQFDLNVYVQRIGQEYRNEILRVSTRYQSSEKAYLSINLETLLANLLEKKDRPALDTFFEGSDQKQISKTSMEKINAWLPLSRNHRLWSKLESFHKIICKGCWPLSPYAAWLLFYLAAGGQHLQQRSALALLSEALLKRDSVEVNSYAWVMEAVDLWSDSLESELLTAEESGSRGAIAHAYSSAISKVGQHLARNEVRVLRGIVLSSKLGATTKNRFEAIECLAALSGINQEETGQVLKLLEDERNIISWDERFNQYEITGDTVTRPQFLALLRKKVNDNFGKLGRSQLFLYGARLYCPEIIKDCDCDFSENHKITTPEWLFAARVTTFESLEQTIFVADSHKIVLKGHPDSRTR